MDDAIGLTEHAVRKWEQSKAQPRADALGRVADATGKPVSWFYGEDDGPEDELAALLRRQQTVEEQLGFLRVFIERIAVEKGLLVYHSPGGLLPETPRIAPRRYVAGVTRLEW